MTGVFDNISVVMRHTLVQVLTPDDMRGRVSAVNNIFIGASNELGGFESGLTARLFGVTALRGGRRHRHAARRAGRRPARFRRCGRSGALHDVKALQETAESTPAPAGQ